MSEHPLLGAMVERRGQRMGIMAASLFLVTIGESVHSMLPLLFLSCARILCARSLLNELALPSFVPAPSGDEKGSDRGATVGRAKREEEGGMQSRLLTRRLCTVVVVMCVVGQSGRVELLVPSPIQYDNNGA